MKHYAGLDVLVKETSVCIVDETGKICREVKVSSHPGDLVKLLQDPVWHLARIGLEGTSNRCVIGILRRPYCAGVRCSTDGETPSLDRRPALWQLLKSRTPSKAYARHA
jgi:hypothetical protein